MTFLGYFLTCLVNTIKTNDTRPTGDNMDNVGCQQNSCEAKMR